MLIALAAIFVQQTFASVGKVLPAVLAPLVITELHADLAWVGVYYGVSAAASLVAQMGCGSFIVRYGALRMSQTALLLLGGGMAAARKVRCPRSPPRRSSAAAVPRSRPDQLAIARPGFATPSGAIGIFDKAGRSTGRLADLRLSKPGDGGCSEMAWRGVGHCSGMCAIRGSAAAIARPVRR
jgi:hypothetical protein